MLVHNSSHITVTEVAFGPDFPSQPLCFYVADIFTSMADYLILQAQFDAHMIASPHLPADAKLHPK